MVSAAVAAAILYFFISQPGLARGAPVDGRIGLIGQAAFKKLEEYPLGPLVVIGFAGGNLAVPIVGEAERLYLRAEHGYIGTGGDGRVRPGLDGIVFCREPKGIEAHRVQDIVSVHAQVAAIDISSRIAFWVTDVQALG
ncbi:hypothetical protein MASR2M78_30330 [Treponema sp.]